MAPGTLSVSGFWRDDYNRRPFPKPNLLFDRTGELVGAPLLCVALLDVADPIAAPVASDASGEHWRQTDLRPAFVLRSAETTFFVPHYFQYFFLLNSTTYG